MQDTMEYFLGPQRKRFRTKIAISFIVCIHNKNYSDGYVSECLPPIDFFKNVLRISQKNGEEKVGDLEKTLPNPEE